MRMVVMGTGYLGATHAACMAELGMRFSASTSTRPSSRSWKRARCRSSNRALRGASSPHEQRPSALLVLVPRGGRVRRCFFVAVATPQKKGDYGADLCFVDAVIDNLAPLLDKPSLIIGKSTVPVGTATRLGRCVRDLAPAGDAVELVWNPEFLREGFAVQGTLHPDRLVLGVERPGSGRAEGIVREIYADLINDGVPFIVTDLATAELVKVSANAFLATKISFINAIAEVCEAVDADVTVLADAIGYDSRIGRRFLNAGLGFGGGCLPKDIRAFMARAGTRSEPGTDVPA